MPSIGETKGKLLGKDEAIEVLHRFLREKEEINLAYLFGSIARSGFSVRDIDVAVVSKEPNTIFELVSEIAHIFRIPEERVDVINLETAPPHMLYKILKEGVKIVDKGGIEEKLREAACSMIDERMFSSGTLKEFLENGIDEEVIRSRMDILDRYVSLLTRSVLTHKVEEIRKSIELQAIVERCVQVSIEAMVNILRHAVVGLDLGLPETYKECVERAREGGLISSALAEKVDDLVKLRHGIVHGYADLDYGELYRISKEIVEKIYPEFKRIAKELIKRHGKQRFS